MIMLKLAEDKAVMIWSVTFPKEKEMLMEEVILDSTLRFCLEHLLTMLAFPARALLLPLKW